MPKTLADFIADARARTREMPAHELERRIEAGGEVLVIDVREPYEHERGHVPGALLVPRGTLEGAADPANKHRMEALCGAQARPLVVCCDTGARSALAAATLQEMGYPEVYSLAGGMALWEAEDMPMEDGPAPNPLP
ncbi:MAG: rhodanese-like domain-containing protein [Gammaproteobacteria bacterium]|nr:rhodanese-like domain-containing protein [Gammaproteobacteria bacterium]